MNLDLESVILTSSYLGIFLLMISNGIIPFPSSQLLYIIVGYFISVGSLALFPASIIGAIGNTIGNVILYELVRRHGIRYLKKFKVFKENDIRKVEIVFHKRGLWFLFIGKLLPAMKVFIPISAAMGRVHRGIFLMLMLSASWIWSLIFITIGYTFGKSAVTWKSYGAILFIAAAVIAFLFYRMLNSKEVEREMSLLLPEGDTEVQDK